MPSQDISVVQVDPQTRKVFFSIRPKKLQGIQKLIQIVVLSLLNVQGQDVLDPERGGNLPALVGSNFNPDEPDSVLSDVARGVRRTESEIINSQIGVNDNPQERLQNLKILDLVQGTTPDEVFVRIRIISEAGQTSDLAV